MSLALIAAFATSLQIASASFTGAYLALMLFERNRRGSAGGAS